MSWKFLRKTVLMGGAGHQWRLLHVGDFEELKSQSEPLLSIIVGMEAVRHFNVSFIHSICMNFFKLFNILTHYTIIFIIK